MKRIYLLFVLLVGISACTVKQEERKSMTAKYEEMSTNCVGRLLIDVPIAFKPSEVTTGRFRGPGLSPQDPALEVVVRAGRWTRPEFEAEVQKRRNEIKSKSDDTTDILREDKRLSDESTLFRIQRIREAYVSEINFLRGTNLVTVRLKSFHNHFVVAEESLINFAAATRVADSKAGRSPIEGFCLGPVVVAGNFKDESAKFLFRDGQGNDLGIAIDTYKAGGEPPLLTRIAGPDSLLSIFDVKHKVLRARERTVGHLRAQEWLGSANLGKQGDEKTLKFALETLPLAPEKNEANVTLSFETAQPLQDGTPTKNVLSDEEALALWDTIVDSIRLAKS
jgi:hypothetical protein